MDRRCSRRSVVGMFRCVPVAGTRPGVARSGCGGWDAGFVCWSGVQRVPWVAAGARV